MRFRYFSDKLLLQYLMMNLESEIAVTYVFAALLLTAFEVAAPWYCRFPD